MIHHHYAKEWRRSFCCGHPSQDLWIRHHYPHYSILWPSSILGQRLRVRLYPSKIVTSSVLSYKNTILTGDNPRYPPRSQQIGMGSNTCSRFLEQIEKTYDIVNVFLDVTWAGGIGMTIVYAAVWRVGSFSFLIFDFYNKSAVQWGLHVLEPQHWLESEWPLRAGLIRKARICICIIIRSVMSAYALNIKVPIGY